MRDNWSTWKQLLRSETGLGWNPQTGAIDAHATWWDAKIRENPNYKKFRYQGLEHHDELQFIFGDTVATLHGHQLWVYRVDLVAKILLQMCHMKLLILMI